MNFKRIVKYSLGGFFIGLTLNYALLVLLAFMFGSDSIGSLWKSIQVVSKNPEWVLEKLQYPLLLALVGMIIGIVINRIKK